MSAEFLFETQILCRWMRISLPSWFFQKLDADYPALLDYCINGCGFPCPPGFLEIGCGLPYPPRLLYKWMRISLPSQVRKHRDRRFICCRCRSVFITRVFRKNDERFFTPGKLILLPWTRLFPDFISHFTLDGNIIFASHRAPFPGLG